MFAKYYLNDNYNFVCPSSLNYTDTKTMHGAVIGKMSVTELNENFNYYKELYYAIFHKTLTLDKWLEDNSISNPRFTNYLCLFNPIENHLSSGVNFLTTNSSQSTALFGGNNAYLVIKGSYCYHYFDEDPYPIPEGESDLSEGRYAMKAGQTYLLAKLQWGDKYWNGSGWTTTDTTFKIPYMKDDSKSSDRRADNTMFKDLSFINTVSWRIGTDEKGYAIKAPSDVVMGGLP